jgi:hypothetical protein
MKGIQITSNTLAACRKIYKNEHSKFITKSMLLLEDLDKQFEYDGNTFTIAGMWINEDPAIIIIIHDERNNFFRLDHKDVSRMMGFFRYRNRITGIEHPEDHSKKRLRPLNPEKTEE